MAPSTKSEQLLRTLYTTSKLTKAAIAKIERLLDEGADPNFKASDELARTPLHNLAFAPNHEALDLLLAKAPKLAIQIDGLGSTPLHYAVWYSKDVKFWERLVALGNPIDAKDKKGRTPLHGAIDPRGNKTAIKWLHSQGASFAGAVAIAKANAGNIGSEVVTLVEELAKQPVAKPNRKRK